MQVLFCLCIFCLAIKQPSYTGIPLEFVELMTCKNPVIRQS
jgi:hypothetical protein